MRVDVAPDRFRHAVVCRRARPYQYAGWWRESAPVQYATNYGSPTACDGRTAVPAVVVYWFCMQYYRYTSRELQRLDSISRSPIYTHFSETLNGIDSVRAFGATARFIRTFIAPSAGDRAAQPWLTIASTAV